MRVVADTNVVVYGLLWHGPSCQLLNAARQGTVELFTSGALLAELEEVLQREKFLKRLTAAQILPHDLVTGYAALATVVQSPQIAPVVLRDPDDDAVIACAVAAAVLTIVSGDCDLLTLKKYREIEIVKVAEFIARIRQD
ncbi:MAG: putative toxin-antitoxin system toxin component, PIN family [Verrucomicrobiota bacterium]